MDKKLRLLFLKTTRAPLIQLLKIKYQLPILTNVRLSVYDVLGREIKVLVNQEKPAGSMRLNLMEQIFPAVSTFVEWKRINIPIQKNFCC